MSKKNKLERFAENKTFPNLFEYSYERIMGEGFPLQGKWHEEFFHNDNPIVLELGCGKGEYTVGLARAHRDINYIGVDIKGARIWRGLKQSNEEGMKNVAFPTRIPVKAHATRVIASPRRSSSIAIAKLSAPTASSTSRLIAPSCMSSPSMRWWNPKVCRCSMPPTTSMETTTRWK